VHAQSVECHADLTILVGTMILYLGGRFEYFVRSEFEEMCDTIAAKCNSYDLLPKEMRQSLIVRTAEVMSNPRKYGHADNGVETFISNLAQNLSDKTRILRINSQCLSITYENMRPTILQDLFDRVGAKELWTSIGEQAAVKVLFETNNSGQARNEAQSRLNKFMDTRNTIAHPSGNITWPGVADIEGYIQFFEVLAGALSQIAQVYTVSLTTRTSGVLGAVPSPPVAAAPVTGRSVRRTEAVAAELVEKEADIAAPTATKTSQIDSGSPPGGDSLPARETT
jgi:hypothetical protein